MGDLLLTWFGAALFALFIIWGMDAQMPHRPRVVFWLAGLFLLFNMFAQTAFFSSEKGLTGALDGGAAVRQNVDDIRGVLTTLALVPGELQNSHPKQGVKIITSTMLHYGWIPLFYNLWFVVLFGHVLEGLLGWIRFVPIALLGIIVPAALEGFLSPIPGAPANHFCGGASGLVYTFIGAGLIVFPRARCAVALNYDARFWGIALCVLLPVTTLTVRAGLPLTEMIILVGMVGSFLFFQPTFGQLWVPLWGVVIYKLLQDLLLVEPLKHHIISNSTWRIGGGLVMGVVAGLMLDGVRGFRRVWHEPTPRKRGHGTTLPSLKKMEINAHTDIEAAKRYLGQRVFVSDSESIIKFYNEVVTPKYPDLVLPVTEQMSLARLLHSKGREAEALHAYENLLKNYDIDEDRWDVWLTTAELLRKVDPNRRTDMRRYLDKFLESNDIMMRDRLEARHILQELDKEESTDSDPPVEEIPPGNARGVIEENEPTYKAVDANQALSHEAASSYTDQPAHATPPTPSVTSEIETIQLPTVDHDEMPTVDFPRLSPRTFAMVNGQPTGPAERKHARQSEKLSADKMAETYWKPIEMQSSYKLDDERLLVIKSKGNRTTKQEQSSGHYAGADVRDHEPDNQHRAGRLAHIEAIRKDLRPTPSTPPSSSSTDAPPEKIPSNYGVGQIEGDRPRIRLRSENHDQR